MTNEEVLGLLIYCTELDGRHSPNELKVLAWREVFDESAPGMDVGFAREAVRRHYGKYEEMVAPAGICRAWALSRQQKREEDILTINQSEAHCPRRDCMCTHTNGCYRGWMDQPDREVAIPCVICRGELHDVLGAIPPPGQRTERDMRLISNRHKHDKD
jgi:hypothetical protein